MSSVLLNIETVNSLHFKIDFNYYRMMKDLERCSNELCRQTCSVLWNINSSLCVCVCMCMS